MNRADIAEFERIENELYVIADKLVELKRAEARSRLAPVEQMVFKELKFGVDTVEIIDGGPSVLVSCTEYGSYGYFDAFSERFKVDEFCNPKYLLDIIKEK